VSLFASIPSPVGELSAATLEWGRLLELLQGYATASVTKAWLRALVPSADAEWIVAQHALADEARVLLSLGVAPALGGLVDPDISLDKARIPGAALEPEELRSLLALIDDITAWQAVLAEPPEDARERVPRLIASAAALAGSGLARD
jgi:DNA mismatch repair protein MutS2